MKIAGLLLLLAGWITVLAALVMLTSLASRTSFVLAALGIEALGFVLLVRSHVASRRLKGDA
jgi:hypothetical protein